MNRKKFICLLLVVVSIFLAGCNMTTFDKLYCLPKRSEAYQNLQAAMDEHMGGLEFHAPISGDNQQPVQTADLDGDGKAEFLVFAKGTDEKPLKVLIFTPVDDQYVLVDTLEGTGNAFEQVQYVPFSDNPGLDVVIGRQVSEQVVRPVSIYTMVEGKMEQLLTTQYSRFLTTDLDNDGKSELMVLRPGEDPAQNGIAELYSMKQGAVERSHEVTMSEPADCIKRIMSSPLNDGHAAVYVASDVDGSAIITDVYALLDGVLTNVSLSHESGTSVQTLRNYYVYADDIDQDGVLELPDLIPLPNPGEGTYENQHLIRWYAMNSDGSEVTKMHTYHSFTGGWFLELPEEVAEKVNIIQMGNSYEFTLSDGENGQTKLMTLYVFTGQGREEQAVGDNRFVLYRTESTIFAANLDVASVTYKMSQDSTVKAFHLITQSLNSGET